MNIYVGSIENAIWEFQKIGAKVIKRDSVSAEMNLYGPNGVFRLNIREVNTSSLVFPDAARRAFLADREPGE